MQINSVKLVFFSPTRTTKKILDTIVGALGISHVSSLDLGRYRLQGKPMPAIEQDLALFGVPVYEEHTPSFLLPALRQLTGRGQPAILVAVYGNVSFGLALQELLAIATQADFRVIGAAAFVAEHSFCHNDLPIAAGRPDTGDLAQAREFGGEIARRLASTNGRHPPALNVLPGKLPLMARVLPTESFRMFTHAPQVDLDRCNHCQACVQFCPMEAIDHTTLMVDDDQCTRCFACVRRCPAGARQIVLKKRWLVRLAMRNAIHTRQEPQFFFHPDQESAKYQGMRKR